MSRREAILSALHAQLAAALAVPIRRNEALPERLGANGLVMLRDGEPGVPDVTLNPRHEFYSHRTEIEACVPRSASGGADALLDALLTAIGQALNLDPTLGGLAEHMEASAPVVSVLAVEGGAPILAARLEVRLDYLVSDPLTS